MTRFFGLVNPSVPFSWTTGTTITTHRNEVSDVDTDLGGAFYSGVNVSGLKEAIIAIKSSGEWTVTIYAGVRSYPASARDWDKIDTISSSDNRLYKIDCTGVEYLYVGVDALDNPVTVKVGLI